MNFKEFNVDKTNGGKNSAIGSHNKKWKWKES